MPAQPASQTCGILDGLNPEQNQAVQALDGPTMVVAGAGTGKTRVLTRRISHLIASGRAQPGEIMGVTFTNKAAQEMRERVSELAGAAAQDITLGTFHAIALTMLRRHAHAAGLPGPAFSILDDDDQRTVLETVLRTLDVRPDSPSDGARERGRLVRRLHKRISAFKDEGLTPDQARVHFVPSHPDEARAVEVYAAYQDALASRNACDFSDLILHVVTLFDTRPDIRAQETARWRYLLVDEFQDTNPLQYRWLTQLAESHRNLCVVGDIDQAVYEWRSARPDIMLNFADDWPGTNTIVLQANYRSTQPILDVSNAVVADNPRPAPKVLNSGRAGKPVRCEVHISDTEEARALAEEISRRIDHGEAPDEIAILLRSARPMPVFERALHSRSIPYTVVGGQKFHQREEIKDALCWLRLALDPRHELAFRRVANKPARSVGDRSIQRVIDDLYGDPATTLPEACRRTAAAARQGKTRKGLEALADTLAVLPDILAGSPDAGVAIDRILDRVGYRAWRRDVLEDEHWREREEALAGLVDDAGRAAGAEAYLQNAQLMAAADEAPDTARVRISTIHAAKGLEFEVVYTPALEEGVLPNAAALREDYGLREERRIAHVAWTRAKRELVVTWSMARFGQATEPSRFLMAAGIFEPLGSARARKASDLAPDARTKPTRHAAGVGGFHKLRKRGTAPPKRRF